jgi:hypothetical protein
MKALFLSSTWFIGFGLVIAGYDLRYSFDYDSWEYLYASASLIVGMFICMWVGFTVGQLIGDWLLSKLNT